MLSDEFGNCRLHITCEACDHTRTCDPAVLALQVGWECPLDALAKRLSGPSDMAVPSWRLRPLHGDQEGRWAVWVDENWRFTFAFQGEDAVLVDYEDYH
jgi:hypothetical protein